MRTKTTNHGNGILTHSVTKGDETITFKVDEKVLDYRNQIADHARTVIFTKTNTKYGKAEGAVGFWTINKNGTFSTTSGFGWPCVTADTLTDLAHKWWEADGE
jgi:hypothetical protein